MWSDVFAFDARFFRTLGPLLVRPGLLASEYLAGRREHYVQPVRAYVFASLLFFGLAAIAGDPVVRIQLAGADLAAQQAITVVVNGAITYVHFFLVPVFAALVMLFYRRSGRYYIEHLIFALYYGAFVFLVFPIFALIARALGGTPQGSQPASVKVLSAVWGTALFLYLAAALRRVYGTSWPGAFLRGVAIGLLYVLVAAIVIAALILATVLLYQSGGELPFFRGGS